MKLRQIYKKKSHEFHKSIVLQLFKERNKMQLLGTLLILAIYEPVGSIDKLRADVVRDGTGERNDFCGCPQAIQL